MGFPSARLDVAFVVDTTGSMKDDIRAVKDSLFDIVDTIVSKTENLTIRFAIVSYRDHPPQDRSYITRVFDFTDRIKKIHRLISKLKPSEGGDTPEAVADGLYAARTKLSWAKEAYKVLLLVGDAPPHGRDYNTLGDDYFPEGCPHGYDPRKEVQGLKQAFGNSMFIFVCGCNRLVEESFRSIADSIQGGRYYSLLEAEQLPPAILEILEGVSDLIEQDRKVLSYYESHDGAFDLAEAAESLGLKVREMKTSLSRLMELEYITRWPRGRPLTASKTGLSVTMGKVPDAIVAGREFKYDLRVKNPSVSVVSIRVVVSLVTEEEVIEVANERHEVGPRGDQMIQLRLVPMSEAKGRATLKVEVFYGSQSIAAEAHKTRLY
jgi:hypothetical protein